MEPPCALCASGMPGWGNGQRGLNDELRTQRETFESYILIYHTNNREPIAEIFGNPASRAEQIRGFRGNCVLWRYGVHGKLRTMDGSSEESHRDDRFSDFLAR